MAAIAGNDRLIEKQRLQIDDLKRHDEELEAWNKTQATNIITLTNIISQREQEICALNESLKHASAEHRALSDQINALNGNIDELKKTIHSMSIAHQAELQNLHNQLKEAAQRATDLQEQIAARDGTITVMNNKIHELVTAHDLELQSLHSKLKKAATNADELSQIIRAREEEVSNNQVLIHNQEVEINKLRNTILDREKKISDLTIECQQCKDAVADLQAALA